jgi:hypothetical protein
VTASTADIGPLLKALESTSVSDAAAELDSLIRLADNAADELGLLAACVGDFPDSNVVDLARTAGRASAEAADELRTLRRRLDR